MQADDRGRNATAVAWKRQPLEGSGATHPGVHGLRASSVGWDAERLWRTYVTLTDLEAVLRSLGSALGLRPIHHRRPARKATRAESWQRAIHERLGVDASPGGVRKLFVQPRRRRKMHGMQCHTPDSTTAMCSLQTTCEMGWQTWASDA